MVAWISSELAGPTASPAGMLWRTVGFLSITLQRQNFQVLLACAPGLEEQVQGRLGRPLSEVPEFWRAAPDDALTWGDEEFDHLLPEIAPAAESEELGGTGTGLLRAAGVRL